MKYVLLLVTVFIFGLISAQPPTKPLWPKQFDAAFGLNSPAMGSIDAIINGSSHFYYNWDIQASLIDYTEFCIPGLSNYSQNYPCQIFFVNNNTYFSQPKLDVDCCLLFPGVGAVPPNFLADFNYSMSMIAFDILDVPWSTNFWVGPMGFQYWTEVNTGADIQFCDGGSLLWNWAPLNVDEQDPSIFDLPSSQSQCNQACGGMAKRGDDMNMDPMVRLSHSLKN